VNSNDIVKCSRNVTDVAHKVTAVGSRSVQSAENFIAEYAKGDKSIKAYGSYAGVFADPVSGIPSVQQPI
jgi:hypothetical protein